MGKRLRGTTVAEVLYPSPPEELVALAEAWLPDASQIILDAIWAGYDRLVANDGIGHALSLATDDLERGITQLLELAIRAGLNGDEPFDIQHGVPEGESRKPPPARPPEYDIAFIHFGNVRLIWPLEAKVMTPDRPLRQYTDAVTDRYLTCEYAPFCGEGGMVGYALSNCVDQLFRDLAEALGIEFEIPERWHLRHHRTSMHVRAVPAGKPYPASFRLHHLMMEFGSSASKT